MRKGLRDLRRAKRGEWEEKRYQYLKERKGFKEVCKESKLRWKKEIEEELKAIATEENFSRFVNKGRRQRPRVQGEIIEEDWVKHFKKLLNGEGSEERGWREEAIGEEGDEFWDREITEEEVNEVIGKIPVRKAAGTDEIEPEVWKFATKSIDKVYWIYLTKYGGVESYRRNGKL